jgi:hypothetical protein
MKFIGALRAAVAYSSILIAFPIPLRLFNALAKTAIFLKEAVVGTNGMKMM